MVKQLVNLMGRVIRDERGAEGLEKILILAAIVIPLLGVLLIFKDKIQQWVSGSWEAMTTQSSTASSSTPNPAVPSP